MKSSKMLGLLTAVMISSVCIAQAPKKNRRVKMLAYEFQNGARYCQFLSQEEMEIGLSLIRAANSDLTFEEVLAAMNTKIDGKDAVKFAESQSADVAQLYAQELVKLYAMFNFIVREKNAGNMTPDQLIDNANLWQEVCDFASSLYQDNE